MSNQFYYLLERHQRIDDRLRSLQSARRREFWGSDTFEIARLKKLKLALKDRLAGFVKRRTPDHLGA